MARREQNLAKKIICEQKIIALKLRVNKEIYLLDVSPIKEKLFFNGEKLEFIILTGLAEQQFPPF